MQKKKKSHAKYTNNTDLTKCTDKKWQNRNVVELLLFQQLTGQIENSVIQGLLFDTTQ